MTCYYHSSNHFATYECDNIPDHRSRCYGCSHSELAHRKLANKKPNQMLEHLVRQTQNV